MKTLKTSTQAWAKRSREAANTQMSKILRVLLASESCHFQNFKARDCRARGRHAATLAEHDSNMALEISASSRTFSVPAYKRVVSTVAKARQSL